MSLATKERILDAAEGLFANHGFAATSLRQITAVAEVNLAAVNYHFGSKEALLTAVFERRVVPVNQERLRLLDGLEAEAAQGKAIQLEDVVRAFLLPAFNAVEGFGQQGAKFMQLVGRMHSETNEQLRAAFLKLFQPVGQRFVPVLRQLLPTLTEDEVMWRLHFMIGSLAHILVCTQLEEPLMGKLARGGDLVEALVQFNTAGLTAQAPAPVGVRRA
ncbi:MAG: TetR/AcrR family transcriptional regulator [Vicinamibacterales bacterium]|jgi:AcrR family transcriptional regulator|nr:TetR family transcriptional regulator [Acidobacteriota bacterium]MDP6373185.1 TetR/AcrR family transcriptional regulator [Vicinamibacterales bacterium]MDP6610163.1 TetR/AcrR family transcriptional regulator [Vicinamibacterales bacterium]HAK56312.1 TetR family transcriptional regulator [Acidobacteriota bacterium]|tara:strand:- start:441 stop:1091 length:651 start_codon:yes stop_codon:yes gene_type:complete